MCLDPVIPGGVTDQSAPTAPDIKEYFVRFKPKFSADYLKLVLLCLLQGIICLGKITAGILHFSAEKQGVEIITDVVMESDEFLVVAPGFPAACFIAPVFMLHGCFGGRGKQERQDAFEEDSLADFFQFSF